MVKKLYVLSEQSINMRRCPECNGKLTARDFQLTCRRCGLVVDDKSFCLGKFVVFE